MNNPILQSAMHYHNEGLNVIPIVFRDKRPALPAWEEYQTRRSTKAEIKEWFGNGQPHNLGIVHGEVSGGYIAIDIDKDGGIFDRLKSDWPDLFAGRVEQSGSLQGYHIPLRLKILPDFGVDSKHNRPRGNKTWKTELGDVNIRARYCQTLAPPSIHPTGNRYRFVRKGGLTQVHSLDGLIRWLDNLAPPPLTKTPNRLPIRSNAHGGTLLDAVSAAFPDVVSVFEAFGLANTIRCERNGEFRLLGNGGLLVTEDRQRWYSFREEMGGGIFEAWGMCRFGQYDKHRHFRQVLEEMATHAGIEVERVHSCYANKTDQETGEVVERVRVPVWTPKYKQMWEFAR